MSKNLHITIPRGGDSPLLGQGKEYTLYIENIIFRTSNNPSEAIDNLEIVLAKPAPVVGQETTLTLVESQKRRTELCYWLANSYFDQAVLPENQDKKADLLQKAVEHWQTARTNCKAATKTVTKAEKPFFSAQLVKIETQLLTCVLTKLPKGKQFLTPEDLKNRNAAIIEFQETSQAIINDKTLLSSECTITGGIKDTEQLGVLVYELGDILNTDYISIANTATIFGKIGRVGMQNTVVTDPTYLRTLNQVQSIFDNANVAYSQNDTATSSQLTQTGLTMLEAYRAQDIPAVQKAELATNMSSIETSLPANGSKQNNLKTTQKALELLQTAAPLFHEHFQTVDSEHENPFYWLCFTATHANIAYKMSLIINNHPNSPEAVNARKNILHHYNQALTLLSHIKQHLNEYQCIDGLLEVVTGENSEQTETMPVRKLCTTMISETNTILTHIRNTLAKTVTAQTADTQHVFAALRALHALKKDENADITDSRQSTKLKNLITALKRIHGIKSKHKAQKYPGLLEEIIEKGLEFKHDNPAINFFYYNHVLKPLITWWNSETELLNAIENNLQEPTEKIGVLINTLDEILETFNTKQAAIPAALIKKYLKCCQTIIAHAQTRLATDPVAARIEIAYTLSLKCKLNYYRRNVLGHSNVEDDIAIDTKTIQTLFGELAQLDTSNDTIFFNNAYAIAVEQTVQFDMSFELAGWEGAEDYVKAHKSMAYAKNMLSEKNQEKANEYYGQAIETLAKIAPTSARSAWLKKTVIMHVNTIATTNGLGSNKVNNLIRNIAIGPESLIEQYNKLPNTETLTNEQKCADLMQLTRLQCSAAQLYLLNSNNALNKNKTDAAEKGLVYARQCADKARAALKKAASIYDSTKIDLATFDIDPDKKNVALKSTWISIHTYINSFERNYKKTETRFNSAQQSQPVIDVASVLAAAQNSAPGQTITVHSTDGTVLRSLPATTTTTASNSNASPDPGTQAGSSSDSNADTTESAATKVLTATITPDASKTAQQHPATTPDTEISPSPSNTHTTTATESVATEALTAITTPDTSKTAQQHPATTPDTETSPSPPNTDTTTAKAQYNETRTKLEEAKEAEKRLRKKREIEQQKKEEQKRYRQQFKDAEKHITTLKHNANSASKSQKTKRKEAYERTCNHSNPLIALIANIHFFEIRHNNKNHLTDCESYIKNAETALAELGTEELKKYQQHAEGINALLEKFEANKQHFSALKERWRQNDLAAKEQHARDEKAKSEAKKAREKAQEPSLRRQLKKVQGQLLQAKTESKALELQLQTAEAKKALLEQQLEEATEKLEKAEKSTTKGHTQITLLQQQVAKAKAKYKKQQKTVKLLKEQLSSAQTQLTASQAKITESEQKLAAAGTETNKLKSQLTAEQTKVMSLTKDKKQLTETASQNSKQLAKLEAAHKSAQTKAESFAAENAALKAKLEKLKVEMDEARAATAEAKKQLATSQQQLQSISSPVEIHIPYPVPEAIYRGAVLLKQGQFQAAFYAFQSLENAAQPEISTLATSYMANAALYWGNAHFAEQEYDLAYTAFQKAENSPHTELRHQALTSMAATSEAIATLLEANDDAFYQQSCYTRKNGGDKPLPREKAVTANRQNAERLHARAAQTQASFWQAQVAQSAGETTQTV